jgi:hypothetical protein
VAGLAGPGTGETRRPAEMLMGKSGKSVLQEMSDKEVPSHASEKLYPIVYNEAYGIIAGILENRPVMINFGGDGYLTISFSPEGDLEMVQRKSYRSLTIIGQEQEALKQRLAHDKPIWVKRFFLEDPYLGIQDYPSALQDVIQSPSGFGDDKRESLVRDVRLWQESGQFVLQWNNEYYLDKAGQVVSS